MASNAHEQEICPQGLQNVIFKPQSLFLQKHFASFYTGYAYNIVFYEETRNDTIYQNDSELAIYAHDISVKHTKYAWLYSVGIGARLYSPHSAESHQVIHIDFAFPQSNNADIDNFEIRIEAKQSF